LERPRTRFRPAALALAIAALGLAILAPLAQGNVLDPRPAHSPNAEDADALFFLMLGVATAIAVAIHLGLILALVRYRAARGREPARLQGGARLQARVATTLGLLAIAIFAVGVVFTERVKDVEAGGSQGLRASSLVTAQRDLKLPRGDVEPLRINVTGQQWLWRYQYPDGTFSYHELVVPVDTPVVLSIDSTDVVHRWWLPGLGGKFDAVPGKINRTWFKADEEGSWEGQSAAFSGPAYAAMRARVRAVSGPQYEAWLDGQKAGIQVAQSAVQKAVGQ
jgi:cytochrome c oxidase subunit II